ALGEERERPLARRVEQPLPLQSRPQPLELELELAHPLGLDQVDVELEAALGLVERDAAVADDRQAVLRHESGAGERAPEHHALRLRRCLRRGEVEVAGGRAREVGALAVDPEVLQELVGLDELLEIARELADGDEVHSIVDRLWDAGAWPPGTRIWG